MESTSLTIVEELLLNSYPDLASSATTRVDNILELVNDRVEDPREDHIVHPSLGWDSGAHGCGEDVVVEIISLQAKKDKVTPAGVSGGVQVEDENQGSDVLNTSCLSMEVGDDSNLVCQRVSTAWYPRGGLWR